MKKKIKYLMVPTIVIIFVLNINSCYYDNEEALYPSFSNKCDTSNVTYSKHISQTISSYCVSCHGSTYKADGGSIRLDSYKDLTDNIDMVINGITHDPSYTPMPKNAGKLSECVINQFQIWRNAGTPNN